MDRVIVTPRLGMRLANAQWAKSNGADMGAYRSFVGAAIAAMTLVATLVVAGPAQAAGAGDVSAQSVDPVPGSSITVASCGGILFRRSGDGYVQAAAHSYGECAMWLERKVIGDGGYNWKPVSNRYWMFNSAAKTGFHWNGTNAASRVCLYDSDDEMGGCGPEVW